LDGEIRKKVSKGYPLVNTIFEDTRRAVLFQGGREAFRADLSDRQSLADLLSQFYAYTEPDIEEFEQAVAEFKERIPDLARALLEKITDAHKANVKFKTAFGDFFELCQTALNPNIRREAVDEMLVQHLLTERLIRRIFQNAEFTRRNVIALEIERVIDALVSKSFDRDEFLKSLDRFYRAIEDAARSIGEFTEKQHFLNSVYERFFQGYSIKVADTHGIVYTPQAIVDFMCESVVEVLKDEFGLSLGSPGVNILDPCTGTGNFIVNLLRRISPRELQRTYREQLFANEVMLLPYYIAALNIEHEFYDRTGNYEPFEGLCFVDTLELAEREQAEFSFMTEENTARVKRQKKTPITVIVGNPPYNMGQVNENDNNKNRRYEIVDRRIADSFAKDSKATLRKQLYDPYVKFFRWATDRLQGRDGVVCLVSNNSFVDQIAFDGMRKHLIRDFSIIYHLDLHGNVRKNPRLSGTTHNVFGIQVGVGITIAIRNKKHTEQGQKLCYHRVPDDWRREEKLNWLWRSRSLKGVEWQVLEPDTHGNWLATENGMEFSEYLSIGSKEAKSSGSTEADSIFRTYGRGVATNCDRHVYSFDYNALMEHASRMVENYNSELDRWKRKGQPANLEEFLEVDERAHKWIRNTKRTLLRGHYAEFADCKIRHALYRPFTNVFYYFDRFFNEDTYLFPQFFPTPETERENRAIVISDIGYRADSFSTLVTASLTDLHLCATTDSHQCFPFFFYDEDGTNRRENITDWALEQFRSKYAESSITKWDIFYYVYGVLHLPSYREKFADNLKRELPRIPFMVDFWGFAKAGKHLANLHLNYEQAEPWPLRWIHAEGKPL
jgi:predicted helicase